MTSITDYMPYWMTDRFGFFRGVIVPMSVIFFALSITMVGIVAGVRYLEGVHCVERGAAMQIDMRWGFWTGCMVNINGQLLPSSEVVAVDRGGRIAFEPKPYVRLAPPQTGK